jgi:hypothetical protein
MPLDQSANFVRETTTEAVDSTQTTIGVSNASAFPDPANGEYNVVCWDADQFPRPDQDADVEIWRVTGRDTGTDTLTVTRGAENTTAASHPDGSAVQLAPTAKMFQDIQTKTQGLSDDGTSLDIEKVVVGGTLYEEDDNSPLTASGTSSASVSLSKSYDQVILMSSFDVVGYNELQVNGDTGSNYERVNLDGTSSSGVTEWGIPRGNTRPFLQLFDVDSRIRISLPACAASASQLMSGENANLGGSGISTIRLSDSGGVARDAKVRIFGRDI